MRVFMLSLALAIALPLAAVLWWLVFHWHLLGA